MADRDHGGYASLAPGLAPASVDSDGEGAAVCAPSSLAAADGGELCPAPPSASPSSRSVTLRSPSDFVAELADGAQVVALGLDFVFQLSERLPQVPGDLCGVTARDAIPAPALPGERRKALRSDDDQRDHEDEHGFGEADAEEFGSHLYT